MTQSHGDGVIAAMMASTTPVVDEEPTGRRHPTRQRPDRPRFS